MTPNGPNMTTAGMYPVRIMPPQMGAQSYYTYQPLMPHEMMYQHSRNYFNYYGTDGSGGGPLNLPEQDVSSMVQRPSHIGNLKLTHGPADCAYRHPEPQIRPQPCGAATVVVTLAEIRQGDAGHTPRRFSKRDRRTFITE